LYSELIASLQKNVLKEYGFQGTDQDLEWFRSGLGQYRDDMEVQNIPYYSKYNRARNGKLNVGDTIPEIMLTNIDGNERMSLNEYYQKQCKQMKLTSAPMVIVAGSVT